MPGISLAQKRVVAGDSVTSMRRRESGSGSLGAPRMRVFLAGLVALPAVIAVGAAIAQAMRGAQALGATDAVVSVGPALSAAARSSP
jgi:hypothetical protein